MPFHMVIFPLAILEVRCMHAEGSGIKSKNEVIPSLIPTG